MTASRLQEWVDFLEEDGWPFCSDVEQGFITSCSVSLEQGLVLSPRRRRRLEELYRHVRKSLSR